MASPPLWRGPGARIDSPVFLALPCFSLGNMLKLVLVYKSTVVLLRHGDELNRASAQQYTLTRLSTQYSVKLVTTPRQWGDRYVPQVHTTGGGPANLAPLGSNNVNQTRTRVTHIPVPMSATSLHKVACRHLEDASNVT